MRFNPKARLDTSRMGDAGRGQRAVVAAVAGGIPIPGGAAGGGIGGLHHRRDRRRGRACGSAAAAAARATAGGQATDTGSLRSSARAARTPTSSADCARVAVENSL